MKATKAINQYRNKVLGLDKKTYRDLQAGKDVTVPDSVVKKYPHLFEAVKKEVKK